MKYYALQVMTREEAKYLALVRTSLQVEAPDFTNHGKFLWPRRKLTIRRRGKQKEEMASIFPGYLFYEAEDLPPQVYWALKRTSGFVRFLKNNQQIEPLAGTDKGLLLHFLSFGEVVDKSRVRFDENNRIQVLDGPMKGLEGQIVKVNRRKKRAKVRLNLYSQSFLVDFGFDFLVKKGENDSRKAK
ncbi:MAG TPA: antiterminator LoaP [Sediminispirochaeta sp.]|nr:antiterminator LoaP [Sediminispirochaeta sp.]